MKKIKCNIRISLKYQRCYQSWYWYKVCTKVATL